MLKKKSSVVSKRILILVAEGELFLRRALKLKFRFENPYNNKLR